MAWDVTAPDIYADSQIDKTAVKPGATADKAAQNEIDKYARLASTCIFCPFATETAGTRHDMATELTQEIGRRITTSQRMPGKQHSCFIACPRLFRGICGLLPEHHNHRMRRRCSHCAPKLYTILCSYTVLQCMFGPPAQSP